MKRFFDNLLIDLIAAGLMIGMIATGYILHFPLPPRSNKYLTLWTLTRHQWGEVHFWISLALLGVILLHLCLHWQWLVVSLKRRFRPAKPSPGSPVVSGVMTFLVLATILVLFGWAAHSNVQRITEPRDDVCPLPAPGRGNNAVDGSGTMPQTPTQDGHLKVAFWKDVYPVLERSCLSCHGPKKQRGDFRVDKKEDFFGKGGSRPLVVPGKSAESLLIAIVSGQKKDIPMPDVHRLPDEKVALLRAWIDAGASWPERTGDK
jgi:Domain of unknown function (DUF4405)/Planctomycete cytochrome C